MIINYLINGIILYLIGYWIYRAATKKKRAQEKLDKENKFAEEHDRFQFDEANIMDKWTCKVRGGGGGGKGEQLLNAVEQRVREAKFPINLTWSRETMYFDEARTKSQPFLVFVNNSKETPQLKPYKMLVGASDWGELLEVAWYLMADRTESAYGASVGLLPSELPSWLMRDVRNFSLLIGTIVQNETKRLADEVASGFITGGGKDKGFLDVT